MIQEAIRLSQKQKQVIKDLQNDFVLITSNEVNGAWVGNSKGQYHINNRVFYNLLDKGLINQELQYPFNYVLTTLGKIIQP
jgi:hypothetical protein